MAIETNSLHQFSSFNNIFTFSCLTREEIAVPNETYRSYGPANVIFQSGGTYNNKVTTEYETAIGGKLEYYIDNVMIEALCVPNTKSRSTNATYIEFTVTEPYSMGLFLQTCQIAANTSGYTNYQRAPYMLSIEFIGYDDDGDIIVTESGQNLRRDIPVKITNITFEVNQGGTVYTVEAMPWNEQAYLDDKTGVPIDIALKGKSIEKCLQSGEQSLCTIMNGHFEELKQQNKLLEADEFVVTFPKDIATKFNPAQAASTTDLGATTKSTTSRRGSSLFGRVAAGAIGGIISGGLSGNKNIGQNALSGALGGVFGGGLGGFGGGLIGGLLTNFKDGNTQGLFEGISGFLGAQAPQNFESFLSMITGQVLTKSSIGENLARIAQDPGSLNNLGKAKIISGHEEQGKAPMAQTGQVYDKKNKVYTRAKNVVSNDERVFEYPAGTSMIKIIEDVVLTSAWAKELKERAPDENGMVPWFRIDAETYLKANQTQENVYGEDAKVFHYKVVEYMIHSSHLQRPSDPGVNYNALRQNAIKEYNYIYSGENTDILNFDIQFNAAFFQFLQSDYGQGTVDFKTGGIQQNTVENKPETLTMKTENSGAFSANGAVVQSFNPSSSTQGNGGAGIDNSKIRWARQFHDNILGSGSMDLVEVDLEIFGDPYFIVDTGMGNWTDEPGSLNSTANGQVEYQRSECDILLNFRTPIDYNPETGGMIFPEDTIPVQQFSGLYRVTKITNEIRGNKFTQVLKLLRRRGQPEDTNTTGDNPVKVRDTQPNENMASPYKG